MCTRAILRRWSFGLGLLVLAAAPGLGQLSRGFYTVAPCRVVDTRNATGAWGGPALAANTSRSFTITGRCGVPTSADAVSLNITAVASTASGTLRVYPAGTPLPGTSSLNYPAAKARANNGNYGLGSGGAVAVRVDQPSGSVHFVLDVAGYYETGGAPPPPGTGVHLWSRDFGETGPTDNVVPLGVAVDVLGEISMVGYLQNRADLGTGSLISAGGTDIFVARYSSAGTPLWSRRIGSASDERAKAVAVDGSGNVFVTGFFRGTVDFGGGPVSAATNAANAFLAKYSPTGGHLWSRRLSTGSGLDDGTALAVDGIGNVLVGGILYQTSDFGGGPLTTAGGADIFLEKLSSSTGAHIWSKRVGGAGEDWVYGLAVNGSGGPALIGSSVGSADFGGGVLGGAGGKDIIVAQYLSTGGHGWSRRVGGSADDVGRGIAVDGAGNVVVTGNFASSSINFGSGALANSGGADIFLTRYDAGGSALWSKRFGSSLSLAENAYAVATDGAGNILLTGSVVDTIDFGGGALPGDGYYDIFLAKFDSAGAHSWSKRTGAGEGTDIAADALGNVIAAGDFSGATTVNLGGNNLLSPGGTDTFLVKFGP
ncbi:MAG: SBBP repeat-containing protein [Acidobacteriota bacterium]|nr:SBBP repeat-containing protein [Acidobacteriota bacterium]